MRISTKQLTVVFAALTVGLYLIAKFNNDLLIGATCYVCSLFMAMATVCGLIELYTE